MSEDSGFISKKKPNVDERSHGLDFFGSVGNGMLANEAQRNAQGLTPLNFGVDIHTGIRMSVVDGFSTTEGTENTETMRNSSGLTPLSHHQKDLSGLSVPLSLRGEFHKRGVI